MGGTTKVTKSQDKSSQISIVKSNVVANGELLEIIK